MDEIENRVPASPASPEEAGDGGRGPARKADARERQAGESVAAVTNETPAPLFELLRNSWRNARSGASISLFVSAPIAAGVVGVALGISVFTGMADGFYGLPWLLWRCLKGCLALAGLFGAVGALFGWIFNRIAARPRSAIEPAEPRDAFRVWRRIGGVSLVLATVAFTAGGSLGWKVDRHLKTVVAETDRLDPNWRLYDLMAEREEVLDEENSAILVNEVASRLPENWPLPSRTEGVPIAEAEKVKEAFDRLMSAEDRRRLDEETTETLRAELETHREAVEIARSVANFDGGRHEIELGPTLIDTELPETQAARSVARLLLVDSALSAQDGDFNDALDSCRAILGAARSIGDEPFIISQLVRISIDGMATPAIRRVLGQGEPSDAALEEMQSLVVKELHQPLVKYALRGERAINVELIRRVGAGELPITALSGGTEAFDPSSGRRELLAPWGTLMFAQQQAVQLEWLNDLLVIAEQPASERMNAMEEWNARLNRSTTSWLGIIKSAIPRLLSPAQPVFLSHCLRIQADLGATVLLLAAERHRRVTGSWPASIAEISPEILPDPPLDPFSGEPFRLEHMDGGLRIYSVGPNLVDEHGAFEPKQWGKSGLNDDVGTSGWDVDLRSQPAERQETEAATIESTIP